MGMNNVFNMEGMVARYWLRHPLAWLRMKRKQFSWAIHRCTHGWCNLDVYNLGPWFISVFPEMLRQLAYEAQGCPMEYKNLNEWKTQLFKIAEAIERYDEAEWDNRNEFARDFYAEGHKNDEFARVVRDAYFRRNKEIAEEAYQDFKEAMMWVIEHIYWLWD